MYIAAQTGHCAIPTGVALMIACWRQNRGRLPVAPKYATADTALLRATLGIATYICRTG